jgi:hypothetical protein
MKKLGCYAISLLLAFFVLSSSAYAQFSEAQSVPGSQVAGTPSVGYVPIGTGLGSVWSNLFGAEDTWTASQSGTKLFSLTNSAPLGTIDLQTVVPTNGFYTSGSGAVYQICPLTGCLAGDHQQSSLYVKSTAALGASVAEYMVVFDSYLNSGFASGWQASHGYSVGQEINTAGNIYVCTTGELALARIADPLARVVQLLMGR